VHTVGDDHRFEWPLLGEPSSHRGTVGLPCTSRLFLQKMPRISGKRRLRVRFPIGAVAQLGERMTGSHEVRGSIPLGSTIQAEDRKPTLVGFFFFVQRFGALP
jgi:hypothetical protein